jgi:hypothetical protein
MTCHSSTPAANHVWLNEFLQLMQIILGVATLKIEMSIPVQFVLAEVGNGIVMNVGMFFTSICSDFTVQCTNFVSCPLMP